MRTCLPARPLRAGALLGLLAVAAGLVLAPAYRTASAQPPGQLPAGLAVVPADAAVFVHADVASIWGHPLGQAIRGADPKLTEELTGQARTIFGATPEQLQSVTLFFPKLQQPEDGNSFGLVLTFKEPYDQQKLKAGFTQLLKKEVAVKYSVHTPSDKTAIWLVGLHDDYAKPRAADRTGPLTAAIKEAATGKHALVAGVNPANLPDELRRDDLPPPFRAFQPLLRAESLAAYLDLGKDLSAEVRVRSATPAKAVEAEKALAAIAALLQEGLGQVGKQVGGDAGDPLAKDFQAILAAAQEALKGAKYSTEGTETRATARIRGDLPYAKALAAAVAKTREAAARAQSQNNLKQIALAMHNYHDVHNAFPPAAVCDKNGKPTLSWRVLILPYLEQDNLYKEFKLDEPWDGPNNKKLLEKMPRVYAVPTQAAKDLADHKTHYRVFVGNGALFDYLRGPKITEITDGTSNTIMVVTAAEAVPWTKPDELAFDPDKDMTKLLGSPSPGGPQAAYADGSVRVFSKALSRKTLNALITRAGGEVINDDELP